MQPGGRLLLTTCANAPAIDHIYLFRTVDEIEQLLAAAGYRVADRVVLPYGRKTVAESLRDGDTINYGALLERK